MSAELNRPILQRSGSDCQIAPWRRELAESYRSVDELLAVLGLSPGDLPDLDARPEDFRLLAPRPFVSLMAYGDPNDPLLRQVLPVRAERAAQPGYLPDPVGDLAAECAPGLLRKYAGRALVITTGACAIHCRYCFRRHFPYPARGPAQQRWTEISQRLAADPSVHEVILSGGDPLMLTDAELSALIASLAEIPSLRRLRLHTRLPLVLPSRVTQGLCRVLSEGRLQTLMVIHANHPRELGADAESGLARLGHSGIRLLNQSVLLRGINDDADVLAALSERLFDCGVMPYYIHQLDPVVGAAHFQVEEARAKALMATLRGQVSGYLVPRLVREHPGERSKTWVL